MKLDKKLPDELMHVRKFGFCGALNDPDSLSRPYHIVHELAQNACHLLREGRLGESVDQLPLIKDPPAPDEAELAKMAYSFLVQAYVWEPARLGLGGPRTVVPMQLAAPLVSISRQLDEPATYLYSDHTLRNSRLVNPALPPTMDNLRSVYTFSGTRDEDRFVVVHTAYESVGLPAIRAAIDLAAGNPADLDLDAGLACITATMTEMRQEFLRARDTVSPNIFRDEVRLHLMGWHSNVPELVYDGSNLEVAKLRGETGAGSPLLPFFDRFTSVMDRHDPFAGSNTHLQTYFDFDRYRPKWHRAVLDWVSESSRIRDLAKAGRISPHRYNEVVDEIAGLRDDHLRNVGVYLRGSTHPNMQAGYGSGGSNYATYLRFLIDYSKARRLPDEVFATNRAGLE